MAFDAKDRALLACSSLIGYALSARDLTSCERAPLEKWVAGLLECAEKAAEATDKAFDQPEEVA